MKEFNKKTLIEALSTLPEYEPPVSLWDSLEGEMGIVKDDWMPGVGLPDLPAHNPPESVWVNIEKKLRYKSWAGRIVSMPWKMAASIAASLALLLTALWWLNRPEPLAFEGTISYSTEMVDPMLLNNDWDEDESAFQDFLSICESKKTICSQPAFQQLQAELEELTDAKQAIEAAMGDYGYGTTPDLVMQIKKIELERNVVVKKMMVMLI